MNPSPDFGWSLPPGCSERDISGNEDEPEQTECAECNELFNLNDLEDGLCSECIKVVDARTDRQHAENMKAAGLVWCQSVGQWLHPENKQTECLECGKTFDYDDCENDLCPKCEKAVEAQMDADHVASMKTAGLVWCQPAGQWLYPENICKCGRARDLKDAKECSECQAVRFDYMRDFNREMGY